MRNWIDIEIIKPPENKHLNCLCINNSAHSERIETKIVKIRFSSLSITKSNYFYMNGILYKVVAYERSVD